MRSCTSSRCAQVWISSSTTLIHADRHLHLVRRQLGPTFLSHIVYCTNIFTLLSHAPTCIIGMMKSMEGSDGAHSDHAGENLFTRQVATAPFPEGTFLPTLIITSPSNISQTHRILRSDFPQATVLRFWGTSSPEASLLVRYCPGCNFSFTQEQYRGVLDGLMKHSHLPTVRPSHSDLDQSPAD